MDIPKQIGRYQIEKLLGQGGMAAVFLAHDPDLDRQVAVKVLPRSVIMNQDLRERFRREARIIGRLNHPAIVPVYDFGEYEGQPFLVMRYMPGGSLADRLDGPLPLAEVVRLLNRLAPALDRAHAQGVIHRDLKPGNILFDEDNLPYLADFGIARLAEATQSMTIVGTPYYMSPEQAQGDRTLDGRSDLYAMGVIIYQLLSGKAPYAAETPIQVMFKHVHDPVPDILASKPDLPPASQGVIARAMDKQPEARYQTAADLAQAVGRLAEDRTIVEPARVIPDRPTTILPPQEQTVIEKSVFPRQEEATGRQFAEVQPAAAEVRPDRKNNRLLIPVAAGAALLAVLLCAGLVWAANLAGLFSGETTSDVTPPVATTAVVVVPETVETAETITPAADEPTLTAAPSETPTPTQAVTPTPELPPAQAVLGDSWTRPADGMVIVYVPAGSFLMGTSQESDPFAAESEQPPHEVTLDAFWIDQTEVTNAQFAQFVADTGYVTTAEEEGDGLVALDSGTTETIAGTDWRHPHGPETDLNGLENHPVVQVTWYDAEAYCGWAGGQLPTEAQWEYAARGNEGQLYPGGNEFDGSIVNFCDASCIFSWMNLDFDDGYVRTAPVGSYPAGASWVNALDFGGNVWEWIADFYDPGYYANSPTLNPTGPETGEIKVLRGGSWFDDMSHVRYVRRGVGNPLSRHNLFGFRCALPG